MPAPIPYLHLPGTAREALEFYRDVFGGEVFLATLEEFSRTDGPADAIAHGELRGPVHLCASDATGDDVHFAAQGLMMALLGAAEPATLRAWFAALAEGGEVVDPLQERPWGACDGQVRDRHGVLWLIGFEHGGDSTGQATITEA
ncbi:VOC family protein [Brachybacterium aquaticum]|uniref:PhnB protein n=1 Tax=Brachybacterium aquaticum TaxID=1432564 RepID=A0A841AF48_9MICO|nr:VOC family protein [Brachybacterium aquaticum]MBB5832221.1 PhnB protein [Brachybacterium aquaticum]